VDRLGWLRARMAAAADAEAIVWRDIGFRYADLLALWDEAGRALDADGVGPGRVVSLEADYAPHAVAMLLALVDRAAVVVPLTSAVRAERDGLLRIAEVGDRVLAGPEEEWKVVPGPAPGGPAHELTRQLVGSGHPGLVLFSSGSTGVSKAALHDLAVLLEKFQTARAGSAQRASSSRRTLAFLLLDHIGGLNTLFHVLATTGTVVSVTDRSPDAVGAAIERHRVELLPTSPTFLNLLLMSEAHTRHDLSSLERVTYGTEVMPASTLERIGEVLPWVAITQTYGLSEVGILRSRSRSSSSLWVKVGGEGFETKVVDGTLRIRARSAMLGYLNHPSPFDAGGWLDTGDEVETDGEWLRFLGRRSEVVNVGGLKVYPAEVESVLLDMRGVAEAVVRGESSPITGQVVVARVTLDRAEPPAAFKRRMRAFCRGRLADYKVPVKVEIADGEQHSARYNRVRRAP
jgi:long-chain acyl-CoA synthetase